ADCFEVLATKGDTRLGGDDVDQMIAALVLGEARRVLGGSFEPHARSKQELRLIAERAKIALSESESVPIRGELSGGHGAKAVVDRVLPRAELENLVSDWVERTIDLCERALRDAGVLPRDVARVVMVGGSTRMPLVRRRVGEAFGTEPYTALNP